MPRAPIVRVSRAGDRQLTDYVLDGRTTRRYIDPLVMDTGPIPRRPLAPIVTRPHYTSQPTLSKHTQTEEEGEPEPEPLRARMGQGSWKGKERALEYQDGRSDAENGEDEEERDIYQYGLRRLKFPRPVRDANTQHPQGIDASTQANEGGSDWEGYPEVPSSLDVPRIQYPNPHPIPITDLNAGRLHENLVAGGPIGTQGVVDQAQVEAGDLQVIFGGDRPNQFLRRVAGEPSGGGYMDSALWQQRHTNLGLTPGASPPTYVPEAIAGIEQMHQMANPARTGEGRFPQPYGMGVAEITPERYQEIAEDLEARRAYFTPESTTGRVLYGLGTLAVGTGGGQMVVGAAGAGLAAGGRMIVNRVMGRGRVPTSRMGGIV